MAVAIESFRNEVLNLPGLSEAQIDGIRVAINGATDRQGAAVLYGLIREYAPPNNASSSVESMTAYVRACALVAKIAGLERVGDRRDSPKPSVAEIVDAEIELDRARRKYLDIIGRSI